MGAAVLDGQLYLNTPSGLFAVVAHGDSAPTVSIATRGARIMVADPSLHRLLIVQHDSDEEYTVAAAVPSKQDHQADLTGPALDVASGHSLPVAVVALAVGAGGQIWAAIRPVHGPVISPTLIRLDPTTLALAPRSRAVSSAVRSFTLIAGESRLWLRDTDNSHRLWCLDTDTGAVLQHWSGIKGTVVPAPDGGMYLTNGNALGLLKLNNTCTPTPP